MDKHKKTNAFNATAAIVQYQHAITHYSRYIK